MMLFLPLLSALFKRSMFIRVSQASILCNANREHAGYYIYSGIYLISHSSFEGERAAQCEHFFSSKSAKIKKNKSNFTGNWNLPHMQHRELWDSRLHFKETIILCSLGSQSVPDCSHRRKSWRGCVELFSAAHFYTFGDPVSVSDRWMLRLSRN